MTERWLIIAHEATNTGAPRMLLEILRGVRAARGPAWSCDIILRRGGALKAEFEALGIVYLLSHPWSEGRTFSAGVFRKFFDRPFGQPWKLRTCVRRLSRNQYDLVYNNTATNEYLVPTVRRFSGPILTHVHELEYVLKKFTGNRGVAQTLENTDRFLAVSQAVADDLKKQGISDDRIRVTPNFLSALPPLRDERERGVLRASLGLSPDAFVVVGCGYVHWLKGTDLFVDVAAALSALTPRKLEFVWLGGAPDSAFERAVRQRVRERNLENVVRFAGPVESSEPWFAAGDVVAVTSRMESFSMVALEAGAAAKPVLGFGEARGFAEFIGDQAEAVISQLDPSAMASAILRLMQNPSAAESRGQMLRKKVADNYLAGPRIKALLSIVDELKQNPGVPP